MINRRTLVVLALAGVTFVLLVIASLIGPDRDVLWIVDDIAFFGFLASALLLILLTVAVLARAVAGMKGWKDA
jgi:hypothetical protein